MRRILTVLLVSLAVLVSVPLLCLAGIGPNRGLPAVNAVNSTDNNFYLMIAGGGRDNVAGNAGSVMCVKCHSRNPARYTSAGAANDNLIGSHWVTLNFNDTNEGGGYADTNRTGTWPRTSTLEYEKISAWAASNHPSKYGPKGSAVPASQEGTAGEMLCESCHNIVNNVGYGKLLDYAKGNAVSTLCVGCHSDMNAAVNAEWMYFVTPTGATFGGTQHHRNSMSVINGLYGGSATQAAVIGAHNMGLVGTGYYNQTIGGSLYQMWGADKGELTDTTPRAIVFNNAVNKKVLTGPINTTPTGQINTTLIVGGGSYVLVCTNCHKVHGGVTSTGTTILMTRDTNQTAMGPIVTTQASTTTTAVVRMSDALVGGRANMLKDTSPLCLACHQ